METRITAELAKIEQEHDVAIIYACESGSRAWDFASKDSDYDVRFIYVHPPDWYISIYEKRDVIELPIEDDLDINGWDIRKVLKLLRKSNSPLLEWLSSPIVYKRSAKALAPLLDLAEKSFLQETSCHHYLSLARNSLEKIGKSTQARAKTYLYALRPLLCCKWIIKYKERPPMKIGDLLDGLSPAGDARSAIEEILKVKKAGHEKDVIDRVQALDDYMDLCIGEIKENMPKNQAKVKTGIFDQTLRDIIQLAAMKQ